MRKLATFNTPSPATPTMTTTKTSFSPAATVTQQPQRSPWHSPVPYLFGGLAAMLGLIAFALLILACSYWRLSGRLESGDDQSGERDVESGEKDQEDSSAKVVRVYEEKILVIMAGDEKPTFLATPVSSNAFAIGDGKEMMVNNEEEKVGSDKKAKEVIADHEVIISTTTHEENRDGDNQETQQNQEQNH